ncbi:MAG: hypothetical protein ACK5CE_07805 [Actinomycetes bacterium]
MSAIPGRRKRRTVAMFVTTLLVLLSVPALGWVGVRAVLDSTGGRDALADNLPVQTFPGTPTALYLTADAAGVLTSATVFVLAPAGVGGSIVSVPVNADIGFADDARQSLQQVYADGGVDATALAVESVVLVSFNVVEVVDEATVTEMLLPFAPLTITLTSDVRIGDGESEIPSADEVLRAGTVVLDAEMSARVMFAGAGQGDETGRKGNLEGLWAGFAASVSGGRATTLPTNVAPVTMDEFVTRLVAARVQSRGLTTLPLTEEQNPGGGDVVQLDQSEAVFVFASVAPGSMSAPKLGPVFRVEAPPGYDLPVTLRLDKRLVVGATVISVDTSAPSRPDTLFFVPDEVNRDRAQITDEIFGTIVFAEPTVRIDGVDVTLVLGTDYLSSVET